MKESTFFFYLNKLHNKIVSEQLNKRQEEFIRDVEVAKTRLTDNHKALKAIIITDKSTDRAKIDAINSDLQYIISLVKVEYEGSMYIHGLKSGQTSILPTSNITATSEKNTSSTTSGVS